jgi:hypothetical protein
VMQVCEFPKNVSQWFSLQTCQKQFFWKILN